jgi:DNA replication protein DnaC
MKQLEATSTLLLRHHLKALRLPTVGSECEKIATQAAAGNIDHLTYLLQLCELELLERERKATERRIKAARFPTHKTLESFNFAPPTECEQDAGLRTGEGLVPRQS